eukprot:TRINITY_DN2045_c0_g1_i1.p2 TRINITY_DN2045_c0_g1~~TRINITY_DN2045_c0_g1_i1.p2  ORF type:complete len:232 (+),score=75.97 TRINITY_DN2045_c0_g1_i1:77-697(+)
MKAALAACVLIVSASSCDVSCSSFKSETDCENALISTCALCVWSDDGQCTEDPDMCKVCSDCRSTAASACPMFTTSDLCVKLNSDDCVVCAWSGGACEKASCSASCSHFKTETTCMDAASGPCPFTCTWDISKGQCQSLDDAVKDGLKTIVIILIVVGVVLVLGIVACVVCCCCCTGAAASSMMKKEQDALIAGQHQHKGYTQQQA